MRTPYRDPYEWPALLCLVIAAAFVVAAYTPGCHLDTKTFGAPGHRTDMPPVVIVGGVSVPDAEDSGR